MTSSGLLAQIQAGKALEKTTTNDRSAPILRTRPAEISTVRGGGGGPPQLGELFAGGIPKLKSTSSSLGKPPKPKGDSSEPSDSVATNDRQALLAQVQAGEALREVVTNDRSSPFIAGAVVPPIAKGGGRDDGRTPQLGGIFAGGMPKLKSATGNLVAAPTAPPVPSRAAPTLLYHSTPTPPRRAPLPPPLLPKKPKPAPLISEPPNPYAGRPSVFPSGPSSASGGTPLQSTSASTSSSYIVKDPWSSDGDSPSLSIPINNDITSSVSLDSNTLIGYGGFGDLFLGVHQDRGKVALKKPRRLLDEALIRRFLREVDLWCSVSHSYILPCLGMCRVGPDVYVVSPFIENGDLLSCISRGMTLNRRRLLFEVTEALTHLHHRGIVHGDIKAQNILLSDNGSALLCDFGLAKAFDTMATSTDAKGSGSIRWMAPELFENGSRSMASDVYSLGITIAEVLSGQPPFQELSNEGAVMFHIMVKNGRPPKTPLYDPEGKPYSTLWNTAEKCWVAKAEDRPHMAQVLGMLFPLTREKN